MTLDADLRLDRPGGFRLDLRLRVAPGEVVTLLGPNGAGKSTTLRAIAGLAPLTGGRISMSSQDWDVPPRRFTPPRDRGVGVVFQEYRLFPHMSVRENVAFGLRARGVDRHAARRRADEWLDVVGLRDHSGHRPHRLSGGQAQRAALARALATTPEVLLLDEPLAALDVSTRARVRAELSRHLARFGGATLLVSHDPLDAMTLADRLVIVEDGREVQSGTPVEVATRPRTDYVARLVGLNLLGGNATGDSVDLAGGGRLVPADPVRGPVWLAFPPSAVVLHATEPHGSARNHWPVTVTGIEQHGNTVRLHLEGRPTVLADVTPAAVAELRLAPGTALWAAVKATEIRAYPAEPGEGGMAGGAG
ncbi:ABC transporter ATP-binding protein [Stackebrandtia albiflava]|uniref:ABC transporter ATP-binding protein n=1 Tax=Stackebrandtia albiflava TaxID=406432 RepID=UPI001B85E7CD|nr:ABC transporter ATP-binding protein [Stackebrandtia albiflava]